MNSNLKRIIGLGLIIYGVMSFFTGISYAQPATFFEFLGVLCVPLLFCYGGWKLWKAGEKVKVEAEA